MTAKFKRDLFIEYQPFTYPTEPYRIVWYRDENDTLGTDLGGGVDIYEALIIMRKIYITYDHIPPYKVDIEMRAIYGEVYEKALRKWKNKVMGYE